MGWVGGGAGEEGSWGGQTRPGPGCRRAWGVSDAVGGWNSVHITMQTPGLTMEPPSVPVSHYKSGVTRSAQDNGPARPIKRRGLLPRVKGKKPSTSHSLTLWLGKAERAEAASRFPRLIHPPSHKVSIVYSSPEKHPNHTIRLKGGKKTHQTFHLLHQIRCCDTFQKTTKYRILDWLG